MSTMRPARYVVAGRKQETYDTVTLMLRPADPPITAPRPGQFTMLYSFGVGEIPVSVSGIGQDGVLVHLADDDRRLDTDGTQRRATGRRGTREDEAHAGRRHDREPRRIRLG